MPHLRNTPPWYSHLPKMKYNPLHTRDLDNPNSVRTWRPWTLRMSFFINFAILCIILSIAAQVIAHGCSVNGCHVFGPMSASVLPYQTNFAYNLVPTATSVAFDLLWAVVHQDIMRLEPYFQMSTMGGATAGDSLFLRYQYEFAPLLPFRAAKRRHYVVLLSSCIFLLMNFFITPLISGIFTASQITKDMQEFTWRRKLYTSDSGSHTTSSFGYPAYSYNWLNDRLPPFTDPTYALLPIDQLEPNGTCDYCSMETTLFEASLTCETAAVKFSRSDSGLRIDIPGGINSPSGSICEFQNPGNETCDQFTSFTTPWTSIVQRMEAGSGYKNGTDAYIIAWARGAANDTWLGSPPPPSSITALSCNISFHTQLVTVTFESCFGMIGNITRTGVRMPFLGASGFGEALNMPNPLEDHSDQALSIPQEYLDSAGNAVGLGYIPPFLPSATERIQRQLGSCPENYSSLFTDGLPCNVLQIRTGDSLTGYMLNQSTLDTLGQFLDPHTLADTYQQAVQLLFSLWIAKEMVDTDARERITITRQRNPKGFVVDMRGVRGLQVGLAIVAVMAVVLGILISGRRCELDGEPNSLSEVLRLLSRSRDLSLRMENAEFYGPQTMLEVLSEGGSRYILELIDREGPRIQVIHYAKFSPLIPRALDDTEPLNTPVGRSQSSQDQQNLKLWKGKLWQLNPATGVSFVFVYGVVLGLLCAAYSYSREHSGISTFAALDSLGYKVLYSYIPPAIGMSAKSVLVTIGSYHCMFGPYKSIYRKNAPASRSLSIDYDKSPPHFQLLRCLHTRDIALAALTVAILLSHVLPITFSGLFSPSSAFSYNLTEVAAYPDVKINGAFLHPAEEMNYVLMEDPTANFMFQNWTTPGFYVIPFYPLDERMNEYEGTTRGIGVNITCWLIPDENITTGCLPNQTYHSLGENKCTARDWNSGYYYVDFGDHCRYNYSSSLGNLSLALLWSGRPSSDSILPSNNCPGAFIALWGERPANPHPKDESDLYQNKINAVALRCTTQDKVVELNAYVVDERPVWMIEDISDIRPLNSQSVAALYPTNTSAAQKLSSTFIKAMVDGIQAEVRRTPSKIPATQEGFIDYGPTLTFFNHFMVAVEPSIVQNLTNKTHIPNKSHLVDAFEEVYRRLFAINLGLNAMDVLSLGLPHTVPGKIVTYTDRIDVNSTMFTISAIIIFVIMVVWLILFSFQRPRIPYHPPMTLAGMYTALYASNAKEECGKLVGDNPNARAKRLEELDRRYTYGEFEGEDGRKHVGVYRVEQKKYDA